MSESFILPASPRPPPSRLFTVRVWQEDLGEGRSEWRGSVELLGTGKKCYFRGLSQVSEIIAAVLGEISSKEEK